jgi:hypothetical protein
VVKESDINIGAVSTYKIEPLKEGNWVAWRSRMTTILKFQHAYGHVEGTTPKPTDSEGAEKWCHRDLLAQILITNNISDEQMVHVNQDSISTAAQMWQSLCAVHEVRGQSAITAAKRTFYGTRAADEVNIPEHIAKMCRQQNRLNQMGCQISDEEFKSVLVMSLPQLWDHFIASYQGTHVKPDKEGERGITSQELTSVLIDEYQHRLDLDDESRDRAFYAKGGNKRRKVMVHDPTIDDSTKKKCEICGKDNHLTSKCRFKGKPKCGKCGKFGHTTDKCWGKNLPWKKSEKGKESANIAQKDEDAEMSYIASPNVSKMNEDSASFYPWYADSATTSHITNTRSAFIDYKPIEPIPIYGLGKSYVWAYGRGTVEALSFKKGKTRTFYLKETLFTPDHPDNLLSIGRIDDNGGKFVFGNRKAILYDDKGNEVVSGKLSSNRLYPLDIYRRIDAEKSNISTINKRATWDEWHRKFGHVSASGLQRLLTGNLVDGFDVDENSVMDDCDACIQAKQSRTPFPEKAKFRSQEPGELTHTDV